MIYYLLMADMPTVETQTKPEIVHLPPGASQLFGLYLQQQFKGLLSEADKSKSKRLTEFLSNMATKKAILTPRNSSWDFDFLNEEQSESDHAALNEDETEKFILAVSHNVGNAAMSLMHSENAVSTVHRVLDPFSNADKIQITRNPDGLVEVTSA